MSLSSRVRIVVGWCCGEDIVCGARSHSVECIALLSSSLPLLRLETVSVRSGPGPVPRKPSPESSVPGENLGRGKEAESIAEETWESAGA